MAVKSRGGIRGMSNLSHLELNCKAYPEEKDPQMCKFFKPTIDYLHDGTNHSVDYKKCRYYSDFNGRCCSKAALMNRLSLEMNLAVKNIEQLNNTGDDLANMDELGGYKD